jgi:glycosyltransferase involved in cell wall biosynthesis
VARFRDRGYTSAVPRRDRSVLFLAPEPASPSCRFRVAQYLPELHRRGVAAEVIACGPSLVDRLRAIARARRHPTVVVHRALLSAPEWALLRRAAPHYVFDFDDALPFRDSAAARFDSRQRRARFRRMVAGAARVAAGNDYLAGLAREFNDHVSVVPTAVDLRPYREAAAEAAREPLIGWIGTSANLMYLKPILPALARVRVAGGGTKLEIVCDAFVEHAGLEIVRKPWRLEEEARDLASCRVGIMPLPDDPWTRGKCALKILQYFAAALPVVCSPVGSNLAVVEQGRNGYFASDGAEWTERLEELLGDPDKRRAFGRAGRELVETRYSVEANLEAFLAVLAL